MRRSRRWLASAFTLALLGGGGEGLPAQEAEEDQEECVCVDVDRIREEAREARVHVHRAMADARDAMREAREQVREVRIEVANRARLGVGVDYDQGNRWDSLGVRVTRVPEDGPAGEAGLREGDVIVALDGRSLTEPLADAAVEEALDDEGSRPVQRLVRLLEDHEPGDGVEVTYLRDGVRSTATAELGSLRRMGGLAAPRAPRPPRVFHFREGMPPRPPAVRGLRGGVDRPMSPGISGGPVPARWMEACSDLEGAPGVGPCVAGLRVAGLNPGLAAYFGTEEGVLVMDVADGSSLGLRPGDVILSVGDRDVDEPGDLHRILRSYEEGEQVDLRVRRDGGETEVTVTVP